MSTSDGIHSHSHSQPLAGSAAVACAACRKLKMRCIGAENPPCMRCVRAHRDCVVLLPRRGQQRRSPRIGPKSEASPRKSHEGVVTNGSEESLTPNFDHTSSNLYRSSDNLHGTFATRPGNSRTRSSRDLSDPLPGPNPWSSVSLRSASRCSSTSGSRDSGFSSPDEARYNDVPVSVLHDLVQFFRLKILFFVPLIGESELDDISYVVREKRCLADCAAYVATNYAPGAGMYRRTLACRVAEFLKGLNGPLETDEQRSWTQLQAYATLYAYMPSSDVPHPSIGSRRDKYLDHWTLKSDIERFANRHGVHRAFEEVKVLIENGATDLAETLPFNRYMYWLWLFTMSYHFSLCTGTPPTIKPDYTIKTACLLLSNVAKPANVTRTLAEVDLYMLWNAADLQLPGLGEWWCTPFDSPDLAYAMRVLDDCEGALEVWSRRWGLHGEPNSTYPDVDVPRNGSTAFHFHSTSFFLHTFAIRMMHPRIFRGANSDPQLLAHTRQLCIQLVQRSAGAAERCCRWFIDLHPMKKAVARHMADFGFALMAYCSLYLVRVHELLGALNPDSERHLNVAEQCAQVIIEMASANNRIAATYGQQVLDKLATLDRNANQALDSWLSCSGSMSSHSTTTTTSSPPLVKPPPLQDPSHRIPITWVDETLRSADETIRIIVCQTWTE